MVKYLINIEFMRFRIFHVYVALLMIVAFGGCKSDKTGAEGETTRVVIISTNDIHAQIDKFPKFASFVKQVRAENPNVLLVDAGDRFSGNVYVDNALEKGQPMILLMNKLGYDVAAFGNHDFDYGQVILKKRKGEAAFDLLCANIVSGGSDLGQPAAYKIIEKAGVKFCFFSLIETGSDHIPATNPMNLKEITFDYYKEVALANKELKNQCDVFIGLTHLGFFADSLLAVAMPDFDVIVGGHSHTLIREPKVINGVLVSQTGSNLNYAGVTYLDFKDKKLVAKTYKVFDLKQVGEGDPEIALMVEEFCNRPEFQEKIGMTSAGMKQKENVASMITDAMNVAAGCDFAFYNKGGVRLNSIPKGDITVETIYKIEPFSNYIVTHELTLDEIKSLILNRFNGLKDPAERAIDLYVSEGKYTILKNAAGTGVDVKFTDKNGNKLTDGTKKYKVGLSNYVNSTYDFVGKEKGTDTGIKIVDAVIGFVKEKKDVNYDSKRTFIEKK